ncbi:stage III sporulation protein AB [Tepidibacter thalassicus]|uniref:Stage III sporulation protein AB n=1 Tax=Tepidibacter thalassicus DSM 15285 TaxID=1123350 RepID=A0A1M5Q4C9_9FIRM|nr:stage III sporulation protein AB [Tepidibacter thalassicus]SHH08974.1 stage III sporulation protein AB [Tepidibacter thalassicus DSM 15285]
MLIKTVLTLIIIVCFFLLGEEICKIYKKKYKDISDLIKILETLYMQLEFGLYTLGEVFSKLGERKEFAVSKFFEKLSANLEQNESKDLEKILDETIFLVKENTLLEEKEINELRNLIINLGKSDFYSQERIINLTIENLKKMQQQAFIEITSKGILYKKLTLVMGFLLVIIFF